MQKVFKVYSGKSGKCMCGCSGKWTYASDAVEYGSKDRGYEVYEDEVSDRSVKIITKKVLNDPTVKIEDTYAWMDDGHITRAIYFREVDAAA